MNFVPIEELANSLNVSRRTVDRKLIKLKNKQPDKFNELTKKLEGANKLLYSLEILQYLDNYEKLSVDAVTSILSDDKPEPPPKGKLKPPKAPHIPKVIHLVPTDEQEDMANFNLILDEYRKGENTFIECIEYIGIEVHVVMQWINTRPAFHSIYEETRQVYKQMFDNNIREVARKSLRKMIEGYTEELESVKYDQRMTPNGDIIEIPIERRKTKKLVMPNVNAIMFALTNREPDEWKRIWTYDDSHKTPNQDPLENMSDAELEAIIEKGKDLENLAGNKGLL